MNVPLKHRSPDATEGAVQDTYLQIVSDWLVHSVVSLWMIVTARREYRRVCRVLRLHQVHSAMVAAPRLANEKFFWRKIFDHNPLFVTVTDKQAAKEWIAETKIDIRMPETLWIGTDARDIPDEVWQQPFYLKATHGCAMNIAVVENAPDRAQIIAKANAFLGQTHGRHRHEWAYQDIPPRLIAEREVAKRADLTEIKCFTYGSRVEFFLHLRRRPPGHGARWDRGADGQFVLSQRPTSVNADVDTSPLPGVIDQALDIASKVGSHFDHVRVDFLTDGDTLYLGEITVYHNSGEVDGQGHLLDAPANRIWDISKSWFLTTPQSGWRGVYANALRRRQKRKDRVKG